MHLCYLFLHSRASLLSRPRQRKAQHHVAAPLPSLYHACSLSSPHHFPIGHANSSAIVTSSTPTSLPLLLSQGKGAFCFTAPMPSPERRRAPCSQWPSHSTTRYASVSLGPAPR